MRNAILTISSAAKTATSGKFGAVLKSTLFAVLLAAASMAGAVPIPALRFRSPCRPSWSCWPR